MKQATEKGASKTVKTKTATKTQQKQSKTKITREEELIAAINKLLPELDEECLEALLQSAYNLASSLKEERERAERYEAFEQAVYETFKPKENKKGTSKSSPTKKKTAGESKPVLRIERTDDGRFYNIVFGGKWKLFNIEEMTSLAKIALVKEPLESICPRVYTWLRHERSDMLTDFAIANAASPVIRELVKIIRNNFKLNKK